MLIQTGAHTFEEQRYVGRRGTWNGFNYASSEAKLEYMVEYNKLHSQEKKKWTRNLYWSSPKYRQKEILRARINRWRAKELRLGHKVLKTYAYLEAMGFGGSMWS